MDASRAQDSSRVEKTSGTERWVNGQKKEEQLEEQWYLAEKPSYRKFPKDRKVRSQLNSAKSM